MSLKLNESQIKHITDQLPHFQRAQDATGVPWQALAALWFRESFSVAPPERVGGQFQFDPPLQKSQMRDLLKRFSNATPEAVEEIVKAGQTHFPSAVVLAACFLRLKARFVLTPDATDEEIKDAFYGYNGRKYGGADHSPYVMNGFDADHSDMHLRGTVPDKANPKKRIWVDITDGRPGAFTVYKQLTTHPVNGGLHGSAHGIKVKASIDTRAFEVAMVESSGDHAGVSTRESFPAREGAPEIVNPSIT